MKSYAITAAIALAAVAVAWRTAAIKKIVFGV